MAKDRNGIYTLHTVPIGGIPQAVVAADDNPELPLLLLVHGGPGDPLTPMLKKLGILENRFVICTWDQRGAGKSYREDLPPEHMTVEQFADDTIEVTRWLLEKYHRQKLLLMGFSWGTLISVLAVQKAPELYAAYIGVGQIADQLRSEQLSYDHLLDKARQAGDDTSVKDLLEVGRPPYPKEDTMQQVLKERKVLRKYVEKTGPRVSMAAYYWTIFSCPFYTLKEKFNYFKGMMGGASMFLEVMEMNLAEQVPAVEVPFYVMQGKHDLQTLPQMAKEFVDNLNAPEKGYFCFEKAGHSVISDDPKGFLEKFYAIPGIDKTWAL